MTEVNHVLLKLLDEIDSICCEHGLSYFLSGEAAWNAYNYGEFRTPVPMAEVLMPLNDILEFGKHIDTDKRDLESIFSNKDFGSFFFNYVDSGTLYYDIYKQENGQCPGIHVRIRAIKQDNGSRAGRKATNMKRFWKRYNEAGDPEEMVTGGSFKTRLKERFTKTWMTTHYLRYYRSMLGNIVASQKDFDITGRTYINKVNYDKGAKNRTEFPEGYFSGYEKVTLEGHEYRVPGDIEKLFEMYYGKKWKEKTFGIPGVKRSVVCSTTIPYADFIKAMGENGMSVDRIHALIKAEKDAKEEYQSFEEPIKEIWTKTQRNILVNKMAIQYPPVKSKIINAYKENRWDDLGELLAEIDEYARQFARSGMLVNFDNDITEAYHAWLLNTGDTKFEKRLRNLEAKAGSDK